jgi:L-seryl-tRNA(Ser) seleniumtransferase
MQSAELNAALRRLPKVDEVLGSAPLRELLSRAPRWAVLAAVRDEIERLREQLVKAPAAGEKLDVDARAVEASVLRLTRSSLRPLCNATGVVLHTNLGRAPLARAALERLAEVARGYNNLEYDLDDKARGSRQDHVRDLLCALTGAEDALVVNNCAAAVLLALSGLAAGRAVVVSRGELVEIGGSFRVPDVMRQSGARLVEVGTTNRTRLADYQVDDDVALLLKVHRSNFAVVGFTSEASVGELKTLGRPVMVDLGSGALLDLHLDGATEPTVQALVADGADLVTFSGDKLLGGPQAGILVGKRTLTAPLAKHPLMRALRPDKLSLAALEATLELYRDGRAANEVPALAMLSATEPALQQRAEKLAAACAAARGDLHFTPARVRSAVGGGSLPLCEPWSWAVAVTGRPAAALESALRHANPPVVARITDDRLLLDVRTLMDGDLEMVASAFKEMVLD